MYALVILGILLLPSSGYAEESKENDLGSPIISRITIRGTDIFDFQSNVAINKFPYSAINWLHIRTQDHVIANELLFKVGDKFDPFLVSETERNLRALPFIRAARVNKFPQRDGTIALVVHTNDSWTTEPQINLGGQNRIDEKEVGFKEKNLFGLGKSVGFFYKQTPDVTQREYSYTDPRLLGTRWRLEGKLIDRTDGEEKSASIERPFYSADTKWNARASHNLNETIQDEFQNNINVSQFQQTKETNELSAGTKVGGGRDIVNRVGLRWKKTNLNYERIDQTAPGRNIPPDAQNQTIFMDLTTQKTDFIEMTRLEKMTRVEDINKGPSIRLSPGVSPHQLNGNVDRTEGEVTFEKTIVTKNENLFVQNYSYSGRNAFDDGENQLYGVLWKYYYRPNDFHTLVLNSRANWGDKLDPDNQVKLGGENGLRAYETDAIVGNKGWIFNIEDRMFFIDEVFNLVSIGGVVFYDAGYVWAKGRPVSLSSIQSDIGAGLRFGLTRSSNEVIVRFDVSYKLQTINSSDSRLVVTFGTGQAF